MKHQTRFWHTPEEYFAPGTVLAGQYRLLEITGEGGMGVIYRAAQENVGRDVAVKVLRTRFAQNEMMVHRFENEARIISRLRHPNTIRLFDCQRLPNGSLFIVTELLRGLSLFQLLRPGPLPIDRAMRIADQICGSLSEAHAAGIVHRDLKPENISIDHVGNEDHVRVLDFGIAKLAENSGYQTQPDVLIGTPTYMSPEQASGDVADARSDIYALGVLIFQMIAGHVPFRADTPVALLLKQINEAPPSLRASAPEADVSEELEAFVMKLLAKSPTARPQSIDDVRDQLREIAFRRLWTGLSSAARPCRTPLPAIDPPAVRALVAHRDLERGVMRLEVSPSDPIVIDDSFASAGARLDITPELALASIDLPLSLRHTWLKSATGIVVLAMSAVAAILFRYAIGLTSQAERMNLEPTKVVQEREEPQRATDPSAVLSTTPRPLATMEATGATVGVASDDAALDEALAKDLLPRKEAGAQPKAKPVEQHTALRRSDPEPRTQKPSDLDKTIEKLVSPPREPPNRHPDDNNRTLDDGPIPVEIN